MITYVYTSDGIEPWQLEGFFEGWPNAPSPETHVSILENSAEVVLAVDEETGAVIGFINAVSDGVLSAYIPLLEVLPEYRGRGIGQALVKQMLERLDRLYMVDLTCDEGLQSFYERVGMRRSTGMMLRNYAHQSGDEAPPNPA